MKKSAIVVLAALLAAGLTGCWQLPQPGQSKVLDAQPPRPPAAPAAGYLKKTAVELDPADTRPDSAVESALVWSERYSQAMERIVGLKNDNRDLEDRNKKLLEQVAALQLELAQSKKELSDANDLLIEMRQGLNTWKTNVLGFREEMREAQLAQLGALNKVIRLLGGEVVAPTTQPADKKAEKPDETVSKSDK